MSDLYHHSFLEPVLGYLIFCLISCSADSRATATASSTRECALPPGSVTLFCLRMCHFHGIHRFSPSPGFVFVVVVMERGDWEVPFVYISLPVAL